MSISRASDLGSTPEGEVILAFYDPALNLGNAILVSMKVVETVVLEIFQHSAIQRPAFHSEKEAISSAKMQLLRTEYTARDDLRKICDELDMKQRTSNGEIRFPPKIFDFCLFMISLLQASRKHRMPSIYFTYIRI